MALYKQHKVNPISGCLPMVFQMPVFFALYQVLNKSIELKGAHFLWIKDLAEPDAAFKLSTTLPVIGEYVNILPVLAGIAMFFQQKLSQPQSGQTDQQKTMAIMMPVLFTFLFYNLPSGFILYFFTSSAIMVTLQEFAIKRKKT